MVEIKFKKSKIYYMSNKIRQNFKYNKQTKKRMCVCKKNKKCIQNENSRELINF